MAPVVAPVPDGRHPMGEMSQEVPGDHAFHIFKGGIKLVPSHIRIIRSGDTQVDMAVDKAREEGALRKIDKGQTPYLLVIPVSNRGDKAFRYPQNYILPNRLQGTVDEPSR